jgi:hypothetical protein
MEAGHQALVANQHQQAHECWRKAAMLCPANEHVWRALLHVVPTKNDRYICLKNIIAIKVEPWFNNGTACPGFMPSRLTPGGRGAVTTYPNLPNRVRSNPAFDANTLGLIPAGGQFQVLSGPYCNASTAWWQVNYHGLIGWTAEGQGSTYWLQPA